VKGINKKLGNTTMAKTQPQLHLPTPNTKGGLTYTQNILASSIAQDILTMPTMYMVKITLQTKSMSLK